jgi:hypothetical protein
MPVVITPSAVPSQLSFALDESETQSRIILRAKSETGRRFTLARVLGDRLTAGGAGRLFPATRAHTYRQKLQRSFAAELLCPFDALVQFLDNDLSEEARDDAAAYFAVSGAGSANDPRQSQIVGPRRTRRRDRSNLSFLSLSRTFVACLGNPGPS